MSFYTRIEENEDILTSTDKIIVDYIIKYSDQVLTMSSMDIGINTSSSASALIRLIKRLGYNGLNEFRLDLALDITNSKKEFPNLWVGKDDDVKTISQRLMNIIEYVTQTTMDLINFKQMEETAKKLIDAENIYLYGVGASATVASDLYIKLVRIGKKCTFSYDNSVQMSTAVHATRQDAAIGFSYSGKTASVINSLEKAKANGAYCICVTSTQKPQLKQITDAIYQVPNVEKDLRLGAIGSRYSMLMISDILYMAIAQGNPILVEKYLRETSEIVKPLRN